MPGPWDFTFRPGENLGQALATGINSGSNLAGGFLDARAQQQAMAIQQQQAQQQALLFQQQQAQQIAAQKAAALQVQQAADAQAEWAKMGPNANVGDMIALMQRNPQALSRPGFKEHFDRQSEETKKQFIADISEPIALMKSGRGDLAIEALSRQQVAYEDAGDKGSAQSRAKLAELIQNDPDAGFRGLVQAYGNVATKEQMDSLSRLDSDETKARKDAADAAKAEADAATAREESIRAADTIAARIGLTNAQTNQAYATAKNLSDRLKFDRDKLREEMMLEREKLAAKAAEQAAQGPKFSPTETKIVDNYVTAASEAAVVAAQAKRVAGKYRSESVQSAFSGAPGKFIEWNKSMLGTKDDVTEARALFNEIKNRKVLQNLPPGAASDNDVAMMSRPFPEATDDPTYVADFLESLARVSEMDAALQSGKVEWMSKNRSLSSMRDPAVIDGVEVQAGDTYQQWADKVIERRMPAPTTAKQDLEGGKIKSLRVVSDG